MRVPGPFLVVAAGRFTITSYQLPVIGYQLPVTSNRRGSYGAKMMQAPYLHDACLVLVWCLKGFPRHIMETRRTVWYASSVGITGFYAGQAAARPPPVSWR